MPNKAAPDLLKTNKLVRGDVATFTDDCGRDKYEAGTPGAAALGKDDDALILKPSAIPMAAFSVGQNLGV